MTTFYLLFTLAAIWQSTKCQNLGNPLNGINKNGCPFMPNLANGPIGSIINSPNLLSGGQFPNIGRSIRPGLSNPALIGAALANPSLPSGPLTRSFSVTSSSPLPPSGISILAENLAIEGPVNVGGQLPFLGTVGIEGSFANVGSGVVSYSCGNSDVRIINEASLNGFGPYNLASQGSAFSGQEILAGQNRLLGTNLPGQSLNGLSNAFRVNSVGFNGLPCNLVS